MKNAKKRLRKQPSVVLVLMQCAAVEVEAVVAVEVVVWAALEAVAELLEEWVGWVV